MTYENIRTVNVMNLFSECFFLLLTMLKIHYKNQDFQYVLDANLLWYTYFFLRSLLYECMQS